MLGYLRNQWSALTVYLVRPENSDRQCPIGTDHSALDGGSQQLAVSGASQSSSGAVATVQRRQQCASASSDDRRLPGGCVAQTGRCPAEPSCGPRTRFAVPGRTSARPLGLGASSVRASGSRRRSADGLRGQASAACEGPDAGPRQQSRPVAAAPYRCPFSSPPYHPRSCAMPNSDALIDLDQVRSQVSMGQVLALLNFTPSRRRGSCLRGPCPIHQSTSPRSRCFWVRPIDPPLPLLPLSLRRLPTRFLGHRPRSVGLCGRGGTLQSPRSSHSLAPLTRPPPSLQVAPSPAHFWPPQWSHPRPPPRRPIGKRHRAGCPQANLAPARS